MLFRGWAFGIWFLVLFFNFITFQFLRLTFYCESGIWRKTKIHISSSSSKYGLSWIKSLLLRRAAQQNTMYGTLFLQVAFALLSFHWGLWCIIYVLHKIIFQSSLRSQNKALKCSCISHLLHCSLGLLCPEHLIQWRKHERLWWMLWLKE